MVSGDLYSQTNILSPLVHTESTEAVMTVDDSLLVVLETLIELDATDGALDAVALAMKQQFRLAAVAIGHVDERRVRYEGLSLNEPLGEFEDATKDSIFRHIEPGAVTVVAAQAAAERRIFGLDERTDLHAHVFPVVGADRGTLAIASFGSRSQLENAALRQKLAVVGMIMAARQRATSQVASERNHLDRLIKLQNLTARIIRHDGLVDDGPDILDDIAGVFNYDTVRLGLCFGDEMSYFGTYRDAVQRRSAMVTTATVDTVAAEVIQTSVPQFLNDPQLGAEREIYPFEVRQLISVPLRINGEISGVLTAASGGGRSLVVDDLSVLLMLAESIGLVIANFRRLYEVERRNRQLRLVDSLVTLIAERTMIQQAIPEIARAIANRFAFQLVSIGLIENERLKYTLASVNVPMPPIKGFAESSYVDRGVVGRVIRSGRPEIVHDVRQDPDFIDTGLDARSEICVPIRASGRVIGIINVESGIERPLDDADLEVIQIIARHLGIAFENEALIISERATRRAVEALQQVSTIVTSTLDVDEALRRIVDTLGSNFDYRYVIAGLTEGQFVQPSAAHGIALERLVRIPMSTSVIGRVARDGEALFVPDISAQSGLGLEAFPDGHSLIVAPIARDSMILGVLIVIGSKSRMLTHQDMTMLQMFAQHAGVVLDNARMYEEVRRMAYLDAMTQLPNHRHFQERFISDFERARREERPLAVMVIDFDGFKQVNDRFGHLEGDAVLIAASRRLSERLRQRDLLARYAGDEFVVLLPDTDAQAALLVAERLCDAVGDRPFKTSSGADARLTISIGVAISAMHGQSTKELLSSADNATYAAKHAGRNQVRLAGS